MRENDAAFVKARDGAPLASPYYRTEYCDGVPTAKNMLQETEYALRVITSDWELARMRARLAASLYFDLSHHEMALARKYAQDVETANAMRDRHRREADARDARLRAELERERAENERLKRLASLPTIKADQERFARHQVAERCSACRKLDRTWCDHGADALAVRPSRAYDPGEDAADRWSESQVGL